MPEPPLSTICTFIEQLPAALLVASERGDVVAMSDACARLLPGAAPGTTLEALLAAAGTPPHRKQRVEIGDVPHVVVSLELPPPADVAELASATAHDFNNLLAVIINFATLATTQCPEGSLAIEDLDEVLTAARRAAALTERLLELGASAAANTSR